MFSILILGSVGHTMKPRVPDHIAAIVPYPPGKPLEELEREYGIKGSIKLASNENPLGPSPKAVAAMSSAMARLHRYPDGSGYYLRQKISEKFGLPFDGIILGNGSNEIIEFAVRALVQPGDEVILPDPSFLLYKIVTQSVGGKAIAVPLRDLSIDLDATMAALTSRSRIVFLTNPNNPTGRLMRRGEFDSFLQGLPPEMLVVLDEAYIEFARDQDTPRGFDYIDRQGPHVLVLRTFSKAYGLAGLRIGYGVAAPFIVDILNRVHQPFNTGSLSQVAAIAALEDDDFVRATQEAVWTGLDTLYRGIEKLGLSYVPTQANFFLIEVPFDAKLVFEHMLRQGVIIRPMSAYGMPRTIRVNAGTSEENQRFIGALERTLHELRHAG